MHLAVKRITIYHGDSSGFDLIETAEGHSIFGNQLKPLRNIFISLWFALKCILY